MNVVDRWPVATRFETLEVFIWFRQVSLYTKQAKYFLNARADPGGN